MSPTPDRAGAIVFNAAGQILLVRTSDGTAWALPKGKIEKGETFTTTAKREVLEETGIDIAILNPLGVTTFEQELYDPEDEKKTPWTVSIATMFYRAHAVRKLREGDHETAWVDAHTAFMLLTYEDQRSLLSRCLCWE